MPLQKMISLLVSAHLSIVSLSNFTQSVALTDLESLRKYSAKLNSGAHLETKRNLRNQNIGIKTLGFEIYFKNFYIYQIELGRV